MSRYRLTIAVALILTASFRLYAQWSESFTRVESQTLLPSRPEQSPSPPPASFIDVAQRVLPDVRWLRNPGYTLQRGRELFAFAGSAEPNQDAAADADESAARRIKLAPFALIWFDSERPEAPPLVVQCDSARIQFENPVELGFNARNPGRVTAAWFDGVVEITGPDGLHLRGENFSFSEESLNLYSPFPITFTYGPTQDNVATVHGAADEVLVSFAPTTDPTPDPGMPRIGGIQRLRLRKQIVLDCNYEVRRGKQPPQPASAHISCDDFLEFDAETSVATLLKNVLVRQPTGGDQRPDEAETLRCHQLSLHFVDRRQAPATDPASIAADPGPGIVDAQAAAPINGPAGDSLRGLRVDLVEARGSDRGDRVRLQSDAQRLTADMQLLQFDVATGAAVLSDLDPAGAVQVVRDGTLLRSQVIRVTPDRQSDTRTFTCLGRGLLQQPDPDTGDPLLEATWNERLHAAPDPKTGLLLVQLDQEVRLIVQHRAGILANHLNVWIDDTAVPTDDSADPPRLSGPGRQLAAAARDRLPIRYVEARGGVIMASTEMRAETELLQAVIEPGTLPYTSDDAARLAGDERSSPSQSDEPWRIASQSIFLKLLNAPHSRDVQIAEAHADGSVEITQAAPADPRDGAPSESVSLSGAHLELVNSGDTHQLVTISGSPALMRRGDFLLECRNLQLDRAGNRATVVGAGLLQAPVGRDLNGDELEQPMLLDVKWEEGLTFDGRLAAFRKAVKLQLHDSVLQCDEMDVRLDQPLAFADARPHDAELQIRDVSCRNGVQVEIYDWQANRIVGIRKGRLTQFLLDYQTGAFQGDGPGRIHHWSLRNGRRVAIASRRTAQANSPVESDSLEWEHISVDFDDLLLGNFNERTAELHGRVRAIYAPVQRISETFTRDDLSGDSPSVEHAVWLGCDTMNIELHPVSVSATDGQKRTETRMVIAADGRCELEGRLFHAKADSLSYEEEKMLFTLRGKGDREASIYYQEPGAEPRRIAGQNIWFIPSEQGSKFRLEGSRGFQGSP